ncbi:hypothetical protein Ae406Ps2_3488 [Pseudonocardia sp. Ae406_Ps2]|nr:hypothetical protein Ae331Ps2_2440c [Pseudonocardia sp. Ae331_Ps2]OLM03488.1 hypothetical protein Ae406Ps2_3488 [Pseudonocardia sp. Ae406_Ps2]OLM25046.1 hypothetical protein Ae706Ps2_3479 [Pseudonocardia sp. Ae706_Ps2]
MARPGTVGVALRALRGGHDRPIARMSRTVSPETPGSSHLMIAAVSAST